MKKLLIGLSAFLLFSPLHVFAAEIGKPSLLLQHLSGWSAASVAIAKGIHDTVAVFLLLVCF